MTTVGSNSGSGLNAAKKVHSAVSQTRVPLVEQVSEDSCSVTPGGNIPRRREQRQASRLGEASLIVTLSV